MTIIAEAANYQTEAEELAQTTVIRGMAYELILNGDSAHDVDVLNSPARKTAHDRGCVGSYLGATVRALRIAYDSLLAEDIPAAVAEFLTNVQHAEIAEAIYNNNAPELDKLVSAPKFAWFAQPKLSDEFVSIFAKFGITVDAMTATEAVRRKAVARAAELGKTNG